MPHTKRKKGESGFHHVVTKGDGGQIIFESNADRTCYLEMLDVALDESKVKLHAFCLMSNHMHLLVEDREDELGAFMKRLNETYARYFSKVTDRVGHVFQGRYWSEPVEDNARFLAVLRYIHANPEAAGICRVQDYPWSSYQAYALSSAKKGSGEKRGTGSAASFVETELALSLLGNVEAFERFSASGACSARPFPGSKLSKHLTFDELLNVAFRLLGRDVLNGLKVMDPSDRVPHFIQLLQAGFTTSEIARITGIGRVSIIRAVNAATGTTGEVDTTGDSLRVYRPAL